MLEPLPYAPVERHRKSRTDWRRLAVVLAGFLPSLLCGCLNLEYMVSEPVSIPMFKFYHVLAVVMPLYWLAWLVSIFYLWRSWLGRLMLACCVIWAAMHLLLGAIFLKHVREDDPAGSYYRTQWP